MTDAGPIARLMAADHDRLDALLRRALATGGGIDLGAYAAFRAGLLRHIGMEEKILFPAAQRARGGHPLPSATRLRLEHGALAALLVPSPTTAIAGAIRAILERHNAQEEGVDGVYEACERLVAVEAEDVLAALRDAPDVRVNAHVDGPRVAEAARRAVMRAGWDPALLGL